MLVAYLLPTWTADSHKPPPLAHMAQLMVQGCGGVALRTGTPTRPLRAVDTVGRCRCFVNQTTKFIRMPCYSRKTMVASKRHKELYWFRLKPYV